MSETVTPTSVIRMGKTAARQRGQEWGYWHHADDMQGAAIEKATRAYLDYRHLPADQLAKVVRTAAHHGCANYARTLGGRRGTRPPVAPTDPAELPEPEPWAPGGRHPIGEATDRIAVQQMIAALPDREQTVVRHMAQVRAGSRQPAELAERRRVFAAMAREVGVSERQCHNIYARALARMRGMLTAC